MFPTTKLVFDYLNSQGYLPQIQDNGNLLFRSRDLTYIYVDNDNDAEFLQLILPGIFDVTEDNRDVVLEAMNKVAFSMKVAKPVIINDQVWLFFENLIDSTPDVSTIIPRAIDILAGARDEFYKEME